MLSAVSLEGILRARKIVYQYLRPTPLRHYETLSEAVGCRMFVKHENHNPTGSFKVRGGINLISGLSADEKRRGVITATRGNHGQSVAYASRIFGVPCTVVVPLGNNPEKNQAMKAFGAELIEHGKDFDECRILVEDLTRQRGLRYVNPANEPQLIHGVGTYSLEILEDLPDVDVVIVPIGAGSGACGAVTLFRAVKPSVQIIGVQAEKAPCVYLSWKEGKMVETESSDTFADGLATRVPFELPLSILRGGVDDIILVSEEEIRQAIILLLRTTHNLAEGAGAASVAGACKIKSRLAGKNVAVVLSGGNIDLETLRWVLNTKSAAPAG